MIGGSATHAGIGFQDKVAALIAVHVLADAPVDFFGLPANVTPTSIEMETNAPVDDILVSTSAAGFCFINVKRSVTLSKDAESPLGSVLDQFVRLWIACHSGPSARSWQRPLETNRDRLILVTGGHRSTKFTEAASKVVGRVADRRSITPREAIAKTAAERETYDTFLELLRLSVRRHTGEEPSDELLSSLLSMTRVVILDPDGANKTNVLALLKTSVVADPIETEAAWVELVSECQRLAEARSGADRAGLRNALRSRGIRLAGVPEIAADILTLEGFTTDTLLSLNHLAHLNLPTEHGTERIEIDRNVTHALVEHAQRQSLLVIGAPGSGKSGALYSAATRLLAEGHPVVAIAVDRHPVRTADDLRRDLRLDRPLIEVLRNWTSDKQGILFIDALDATRGGPSDRVFQELIRRVVREAPNWHIVASIRVFDLRFGVIYRDLFVGEPLDDDYRNPDFANVQHLLIPQLTDQELDQVWLKSSPMRDAYFQAPPPLRELLRSPFNLFLLANVLAAGWRDFKGITTQVQLLHLYWAHRVLGNDQRGIARESLLRTALERMLEKRTLQVALHDLPGVQNEDLYRLHSEGVLSPAEGSPNRPARISFAHHVLFDYGVARLVFENGRAVDFAVRLTSSDERALLMAPGAMMAFQILWEEDEGRRPAFWEKAFEVVRADGTGAFCRMLPARVAADLTGDLQDFDPVLDCLLRPHCLDRTAALFVVRHCTGALAAGIAPRPSDASPRGAWPRIANALAKAAIGDVGWMLKPLIGQWVDIPTKLTTDEKAEIGSTARLMLRHGSGEQYDVGMVIVGIQGIARTFESAPEESIEALKHLLSPDHVNAHGHEELSWLAREIRHLLVFAPASSELVSDIYRAGHCTPLPSRDDKTVLARSRIFSLTSDKRQDFQGARYQLFESFPPFFEADPHSATETLIDIVNCFAAEEHKPGDIVPMLLGNFHALYQADHSYAWLRRRGDYETPPISSFELALIKLADKGQIDVFTKVLDVVIRKNRLACIWATLLRAGAARPDQLGRYLVPLLTAAPILGGYDTRKPAGDLITVIHPLLQGEDRISIEKAVLNTTDQTQRILLGCLDQTAILSQTVLDRRRALEEKSSLLANRELIEISSGAIQLDHDWWLKEKGVDLSTEANTKLNKAIGAVEGIRRPEVDESRRLEFVAGRWSEVQNLLQILESRQDIPDALRMSAWNALAEAANAAAETSREVSDLVHFPGLEAMIVGALDKSLWPEAIFDAEREAAFARTPSWGSPAPRVEAAGALMVLARVSENLEDKIVQTIEALARDPSPAVRHQILGRTNLLFSSNRPLMWKLCEIGFSEERNEGVLSFFLNSVGTFLRERPEWIAERLLALDDRISENPRAENRHNDFLSQIVQLLLRLWFVYDQETAGERVRVWITDPLAYATRIQDSLLALRGALLQGDPSRPDTTDDRVRGRTIEIFQSVVFKLGPFFRDLTGPRELTELENQRGQTALRILDQAASEIYFGSGAHGSESYEQIEVKTGTESTEIRTRFLKEMAPSLNALAKVPYPSVTHHLLETLQAFISDDPGMVFRLVTDALAEGGHAGGYQLESLGSDLFVRIVRRYLADYRSMLTSDDDLRRRLMQALDVFVEAGWPEARRLVYELPEMLR